MRPSMSYSGELVVGMATAAGRATPVSALTAVGFFLGVSFGTSSQMLPSEAGVVLFIV